jgi:outer membrane protein OmpA-like peptidoglycan-associated protein
VLVPPAATPEKFSVEKGDFPYLKPLPGAKPMGGQREGTPMSITLPGSDEAQIVGTGSIAKDYSDPPGLSNANFLAQYRGALSKAGWTIVDSSGGIGQSDAVIVAHFAKNGRDIWAYLHHGGGEMLFRVADKGGDNLAQQLAKQCHVALYGVLFDFNKATLKPESASVLSRVADLLTKDPGLKVEVQGHTDNVGSDAYNQKLSEGRANSVMAWLAAHGIAANRLSAKGYGKRMPVADNDSDEGRARNRRVEIARPGCSAPH